MFTHSHVLRWCGVVSAVLLAACARDTVVAGDSGVPSVRGGSPEDRGR